MVSSSAIKALPNVNSLNQIKSLVIRITPNMIYDDMFMNITRRTITDSARRYINEYKKDPIGLIHSAYHLIDNKTHKDRNFSKSLYAVMDGNHRTTALHECAQEKKQSYDIHVYVYSWAQFNYNREEAIQYFEKINKSRKQSNINILDAYSYQSPWVKFFEKIPGTQIVFEQATKKLSWTNVINAYLNVKLHMTPEEDSRVLRNTKKYEIDDLKNGFLNVTQKEIKQFYEFLLWWIPVAEAAKKERGVGTLYSFPFLTAGYLFWSIHRDSVTPEDGLKIVRYPRFQNLLTDARSEFPTFIRHTLFAINYRNTKRKFTIFNEEGRDSRA